MIVDIKRLFKSFRRASLGFISAFKEEQNFRIQLVAALSVIIIGLMFGIEIWQWVVVIMIIFLVLILEIVNSVIERLVDISQPRIHHYAATIKDLMATTVFLSSILSIIIFILIFGPYFIRFFGFNS